MRARDNPFRVDRVLRLRYRFQDQDWKNLLKRLCDLNYRGAILGPDGSGKTTFLEDLGERLKQHEFHVKHLFINRSSKVSVSELVTGTTSEDLILFDGADLLPHWAWHFFLWKSRKAKGMIITTHRKGMLPILMECKTDIYLLHQLAHELVEGHHKLPVPIEELYARHQGNIRDAFRELYDSYALQRFEILKIQDHQARLPA